MTIIDYLSSEGEVTRQSNTWTEVASKSFGIDHVEVRNYVIWCYCEYTTNNKNSVVSARWTLNTAEGANDEFAPPAANSPRAFMTMREISLSAGLYILALEVKSSNAADTITVRRIRVVVMKH